MTHITIVVGAKGGVGTSTLAAIAAARKAQDGRNVLALDLGRSGDFAGVLGVSKYATEVMRGLTLGAGRALNLFDYEEVVIDAGTDLASALDIADTAQSLDSTVTRSVVIVTRPCYLAIRRLAELAIPVDARIWLIEEPGRALGRADIESVTGRAVSCIPHDATVARAIDAGLLASRIPASLRRSVDSALAVTIARAA